MPTKPLTIGVDIRSLRVDQTGIKTYLEEICTEFKNISDSDIHFFFIDSWLPIYSGNRKIGKLTEHFCYQFWKQVTLPLKAFFKRCDIVFCTDNIVPLVHLGYQTIPVFHDAFFFETPENYSKLWLWLYKKTALPAAYRSAYVVTPTNYVKDRIALLTELPPHKLAVVYEAPKTAEHICTDDEGKNILENFGIVKGNYLLHAGAFFNRKNLPALITAFAKIKKIGYPEIKLVLAGPTNVGKAENNFQLIKDTIKNAGLQNDVIITNYITDGQLVTLYKNALMYVFPSVNEGFGIPLLEAFKYHLPVLAANNTCLPEVGGNAILPFDPYNIDEIAQKIKIVLDDDNIRLNLINKGDKRLKEFSWQKAAIELIEIFKKTIKRS